MTAPARTLRWLAGLARAAAWVWRFGTLRLAERLAALAAPGSSLRRPFRGHLLELNIRRSTMHRLLFLEGERFVAERQLLLGLVDEGDTVVDVGANIGYLALLFASAVGPRGSVICVEPEPDNLAELHRHVALNRLPNVEVIPAAAGPERGSATLVRGVNATVEGGAPGDLPVEVRALDDLVSRRVDFLKIDVEGFEDQVLRGASRILDADRPKLFVEVHPGMAGVPRTRALIERLAEARELEFYRLATGRVRRLVSRYFPGFGVERLESVDDALDGVRLASTAWVIARRR
jgi:FkbM family methyltransferase